ncbi:MAG: ankyrin repeat domain-containing protein [Cyanobacteria bacterium P01_H01_bin.121]
MQNHTQTGNLQAIESLVQESLAAEQLTATVSARGKSLNINVTGQTSPDPAIATRLHFGLKQLQLKQFIQLHIDAYQTSQKAPVWQQTLTLSTAPSVPTVTEVLQQLTAPLQTLGGWCWQRLPQRPHHRNLVLVGVPALLVMLCGWVSAHHHWRILEALGAQPEQSLTAAAALGNQTLVEQFLVQGAKVSETNNQGCTPLDLAVRGNHSAIANLLKQRGASHSSKPICLNR